jgi:hypothetical protein
VKNLLLIGAGQLGARYVQSIIDETLNYNIVVVDLSELSLNTAKKIWIEAGGTKSNHKILWTNKLPENIKTYDIAIIATSSRNRATLIKKVATKVFVNYWVLEKILAQSNEELKKIKEATIDAKKVYVNTPRRLWKWYNEIKSKFPEKPYKVTRNGGLWGLAGNSIHFIDLVAWWSGESLISINNEELSKDWFKSKREGYFEVTGKLLAKFSGGTTLILQSSQKISENILKVEFSNNDNCKIYENKGTALFSDGNILEGKLELQSKLAGPMITKILTQGDCELPTLEESSKLHSIFLSSMLEHWNRTNKKNDKLVPIT